MILYKFYSAHCDGVLLSELGTKALLVLLGYYLSRVPVRLRVLHPPLLVFRVRISLVVMGSSIEIIAKGYVCLVFTCLDA